MMIPTRANFLITCEIERLGIDNVLRIAYGKARRRSWQDVWRDPGLFGSVPNLFTTARIHLIHYCPEPVWELASAALTCNPAKRITARQLSTTRKWDDALNQSGSFKQIPRVNEEEKYPTAPTVQSV